MRSFRCILIPLLLFCLRVNAQTDTIFLAGNARNYGDSVVLRWNSRNHVSVIGLLNGNVTVEKQNSGTGNWTKIASIDPTDISKWGISQKETNRQLLLAAASVQQLQKLSAKVTNSIEEGLQKEDEMKFLWMNISLAADLNPHTANLCHMRFTDEDPATDFPLYYRVYCSAPGFVSDTLFYVITKDEFSPGNPGQPGKTEKDGLVEIRWSADKKYSSYFIESSPRGKNNFTQLNRGPLVIPGNQGENPMLYFNDTVINYQPADYRIYGIDMFGDRSAYSPPVTAYGRDKTPPPPLSGFKAKENPDKTITLSWDKPDIVNGEKGIAIAYKHAHEGFYVPAETKLLPLNQTSYTFKTIPKQSDYFFALQIFDTAGNSSLSEAFCQMTDNVPPAKPLGLKAVVDKKGIVKLTWNRNREPDLDGYLIYFSNSLKSEFSGIVNRPLSDTVFWDTLSLKMLNRDVFYQIRAADKRFNLSELSEIAKVSRPDTLPPVAPVIKSFFVTDSSIQFHWIPSSSKDVASHTLRRKHIKSGKISVLQLQIADTIYRDKNIISEDKYEYCIFAQDDSKNISPASNSVLLSSYKNYFKSPVSIVHVQFDSTEKNVIFQWNYNMEGVKKIVIYKGHAIDQVSRMPDVIPAGSVSFTDSRIKTGPVFYAVKLYFTDGTETRLSVPVGLMIP